MRDLRWTALVGCALFGLTAGLSTISDAQTRKTTTTKNKTKAKAKKVVSSSARAKATKAVVRPKTGVVTTGHFRPLRNTDRITVILPRRPATTAKANLNTARSRTTVFTTRSVTPSAQTLNTVTASNFGTTALVINSSRPNWWGYGGPPTTSIYDPRYGYITSVAYPWGNVLYTYGYQVVNYWNGDGYVWMAYPGITGVAYPVIYR